ncbi:MAG: c-type cytochrome [Ignavibacteriales bacterium]|nr:c-type cytochrome [Ignavibacteriales bacterium]
MTPPFKRILKILSFIIGAILALLFLLVGYVTVSWDNSVDRRVPQMNAPTDSASMARGRFLYETSAQCWQCHGENRSPAGLPSGGAVEDLRDLGPGFGVWYIPNITPDKETGIGTWTDGELVRLLREGIKKDGRPAFIMPSERFNGLSDDDVLSLVAYLRSLPAVRNSVPPHEPSLVAKALFSFGIMKAQPEIKEVVKAPPRGVTVEWGKYLTAHASLCMDCHSAVDLSTGQFYKDSLLSGGNFPFGKKGPGQPYDAPTFAFGRNITPDPETGIGSWTEAQFLDAVRIGIRPDGTVLVGHMPYAYIGLWPDDDLRAVFQYLKSVPPVRKLIPPVEFGKIFSEGRGIVLGAAVFDTYCKSCHGEAGKGAPPTKLVLAEIANTIDDATLEKFIVQGQSSLRMPGFGKTLSRDQLSDLVAYIRTLNKQKVISAR